MEVLKEWRNKYLFKAGFALRYDEIKPETNESLSILEYQSDRSAVFIGIQFDDVNKQPYPDEGMFFSLGAELVLNNEVNLEEVDPETRFLEPDRDAYYQKIDLSFDKYFSMSDRLVVELGLKARLNFGSTLLDNYRIGGPNQGKNLTYGFIGLNDSELLPDSHVNLRTSLRLQLNNSFHLAPIVQLLRGSDALSATFNRADDLTVFGGGLLFGYDAPIGPVNFEIGFSSLREDIVLNLGLGYRHIF